MKDSRLNTIYNNLIALRVIQEKMETMEITHSEKRGVAIISRELATEALQEFNHLKTHPDNLDELPF